MYTVQEHEYLLTQEISQELKTLWKRMQLFADEATKEGRTGLREIVQAVGLPGDAEVNLELETNAEGEIEGEITLSGSVKGTVKGTMERSRRIHDDTPAALESVKTKVEALYDTLPTSYPQLVRLYRKQPAKYAPLMRGFQLHNAAQGFRTAFFALCHLQYPEAGRFRGLGVRENGNQYALVGLEDKWSEPAQESEDED